MESTQPAVHFDLWDSLKDPASFLADDRANPARARAAALVRDERQRLGGRATMMEIGCCNGYDYEDFFSKMAELDYLGIDGSSTLVTYCQNRWAPAVFALGTFGSLSTFKAAPWDITYAKAVFEHQEDFQVPLEQLLFVTKRLCIINWYLPPAIEAKLGFNDSAKMFYNRYAAGAVKQTIREASFDLTTELSPSGNELYICRKPARVKTRGKTRK